jgi:hypothetical protein
MTRKKHKPAEPTLAPATAPPAAAPPLPTSTTDPDYREWIDYVVTHGGGFAAPPGATEMTGQPPTIKARSINQIDGLQLENVEGVDIGATTREALEERRAGVLLGKVHQQEAMRAALEPVLHQLGPAGPAPVNVDTPPVPTATTKHAFGLVVDNNSRTAKRGNAAITFGGSEKPWLVFLDLLRRYPGFCPTRELGHAVWNPTNRDYDPDDHTIHRAICDLRKHLAPLEIGVKYTKGIGYRLEEDLAVRLSNQKTTGRQARRRPPD